MKYLVGITFIILITSYNKPLKRSPSTTGYYQSSSGSTGSLIAASGTPFDDAGPSDCAAAMQSHNGTWINLYKNAALTIPAKWVP